MEMESNLMHGYQQAFSMAAAALVQKDPELVAQSALCAYDPAGGFFAVDFLGVEHNVFLLSIVLRNKNKFLTRWIERRSWF